MAEPEVFHVTVEVRRQLRRADGTLDPRREFVRRIVVREAGVKIEEALTTEARGITLLVIGKADDGDSHEVQPVGLPS